MNYDALTPEYRKLQTDRLQKALLRLKDRTTAPGRVVPEAEDLVIGDGRRLNVAVLFLDISGFSSWPSETPIEQNDVLIILNIFFTEMVRIVGDYGGTVEKNTGDGLMAYFEEAGDTVACKRSVACALTMMDSCANLINPLFEGPTGRKLQFRVTIDHGPVTMGRLGQPKNFNAIVAIGTAANVASKMLSHAGAGEIVIGEAVRDRLPSSWQTQWTVLHLLQSGWIYRTTGAHYPLFKYTGRWIRQPGAA